MRCSWRVLAGLLLFVMAATGEPAAQNKELPLFDAHIHYSQGDWDTLSPEQALAILERAGVRRALVSSTPDDGTLTLYQADPKRSIPFLRPYRTRGDMAGWHSDPAVQANVEGRLARGIYKGIGEFHLTAADADKPVVKRGTAAAFFPRPRGRSRPREAPHGVSRGENPLGPCRDVLARQRGPSNRGTLPEGLGGAVHALRCRPGWCPESRVAHPLPASSGPVHGGDRHVGDFAVAFAA